MLFQKEFGPKNILIWKKFMSEKNFSPKKCWSKTILVKKNSKKILSKKNFGPKLNPNFIAFPGWTLQNLVLLCIVPTIQLTISCFWSRLCWKCSSVSCAHHHHHLLPGSLGELHRWPFSAQTQPVLTPNTTQLNPTPHHSTQHHHHCTSDHPNYFPCSGPCGLSS